MSPEVLPTGPDLEAVIDHLRETYPHADVVTIDGAIFFSLDAEKHFPNFVTIVWIDEFDGDKVSDLTDRPGVFRVNIGVSRETCDRLAGSMANADPAAFDRLFPTLYTPSSTGSRSSTPRTRHGVTSSCHSSPRRTTGWPRPVPAIVSTAG